MDIPKSIKDRLIFYKTKFEPHNPPVKITPQLKKCDDCNLIVDRKISTSLNEIPYKHWRKTCDSCGKHYNPRSKKFEDISRAELNRVLREYKKSIDK